MKRARRRQDLERIKRRVACYYGGYAAGNPRLVGKLAQTRVPCSGPCCGNPRRYFGELTRQELRNR